MELDGEKILFAELKANRQGHEQIHVWTAPDVVHSVDADAIAAWAELAGYDDAAEALEAILEAAEGSKVYLAEQATGESVWADAWRLVQIREQARETETARAIQEGTQNDPRSPLLRGTLAAHAAVHEPIDGGECVLDRCRRSVRDRVGLPEPTQKCGANSRNTERDPGAKGEAGVAQVSTQQVPDPDREKIRGLAAAVGPKITESTRKFLHSVTNNSTNPVEDEDPSGVREVDVDPDEIEQLRQKYVNPQPDPEPEPEPEPGLATGEKARFRSGVHPQAERADTEV